MKSYYQLNLVGDTLPVFIGFATPDMVKVTQQSGESELQSAEYVHKRMAKAVLMQILNGSPPKALGQYEFTGEMVEVKTDNPLLVGGNQDRLIHL